MSDISVRVVQFICKLHTGYIIPIEVLPIFIFIVLTRLVALLISTTLLLFKLSWLMLCVCIFPFRLSPSCIFLSLLTKVQMLKQSIISSKRSCANIATNILVAPLVFTFIISVCDVIRSFLHAKASSK